MEWCEIFRTGTHTDKKGRERTWTTADLDRVVKTYDPTQFEAPLVIDHDEGRGPIKGGPAYGWVNGIKRIGEKLFAQFKSVVPEFAEAVNQGFFKNRSTAFFSDGTLRHIAFLGAVPPAVKGMAPFLFTREETDDFTFCEAVGDFQFSQEEDNRMTIEELQAKLKAEQEGRQAADAKIKTLETENTRLGSEFSAAEKKRRKVEIDTFIQNGIRDKKILPAWKEMGLAEFMTNLEEDVDSYEFSEGRKQTPLDWFKGFLNSFSEHKLFDTMAKKPAGAEYSQGKNPVEYIVPSAKSK